MRNRAGWEEWPRRSVSVAADTSWGRHGNVPIYGKYDSCYGAEAGHGAWRLLSCIQQTSRYFRPEPVCERTTIVRREEFVRSNSD